MVSGVFNAAKRYGEYGANFIFGTGSEVMGKTIAESIKNRAANNISLTRSIGRGFKDGFIKSNTEMVSSGGFLKNLLGTFKATPGKMAAGWKGGSGFFSKLKGFVKPLGKLMPFAMNALWFAQSIPDIAARTKDEGIWGGIKETGKTLVNMAVISLAASVGGAFGIVGMLGLPIAASMLTGAILGKSYRDKKAEEEAAKQEAQQANNNPFLAQQKVGQKLDITSAA